MKKTTPYLLTLSLGLILVGCAQRRVQCRDVVQETYVHKYGLELPAEDWQKRGRDGHVVTTRSDGVSVDRSYLHGELQGEVTYTFPHRDTIQRVESYSNGQLVQTVENNASGVPIRETEHQQNGMKTVRNWYEDGTLKCVENYTGNHLLNATYYNPKELIESRIDDGAGERMVRDSFGQIVSKETLQDGQVVQRSHFFQNGNPKEITPYRNGTVEGEKRVFLPTGEPVAIERWVNGEKHGSTVTFENGEKIAEIPYVNGQKDGIERRFRGNEVVQEITWRKDQKHGPSRTYVKGNVRTDWFYKDRDVTEANYQKMLRYQK